MITPADSFARWDRALTLTADARRSTPAALEPSLSKNTPLSETGLPLQTRTGALDHLAQHRALDGGVARLPVVRHLGKSRSGMLTMRYVTLPPGSPPSGYRPS
jgi:hypothetical protein